MVCGGKWGGIRDEGSIGMIELVGVVKLVKGTCYFVGEVECVERSVFDSFCESATFCSSAILVPGAPLSGGPAACGPGPSPTANWSSGSRETTSYIFY